MQLQVEQPYTTAKHILVPFPEQKIQDIDNKSLQTAGTSEPA